MRFRNLECPYDVSFSSQDTKLAGIHALAEEREKLNLNVFEGRKVLVEGGGYNKIWLETQPMGGAMYALRDMEAALNNQLLFMEHARADGRIPGSIAHENGRRVAQFDKFQGFCFADPALDMAYIAGADDEYLRLLYRTLERFDEYLWRTRDTDGDGLLESWCYCDTGEDHAMRYGDAPSHWSLETPPDGYARVPMPSMDVTAYSASARRVLCALSRLLKNNKEAFWREKTADVRARIASGFWNENRGACLDRFKDGSVDPALAHNTLRLMYWGALDAEKAGRFVREHLKNPEEFWTNMPLPSVAANDPLFRNVPTNNWSGQPEGLTYQRAIRALENYGYLTDIVRLGQKLIDATWTARTFTQQYDPFTCAPSLAPEKFLAEGRVVVRENYGPAILAVMEYIAFMYGIRLSRGQIKWGALGGAGEWEYKIHWANREYLLRGDGKTNAAGYVNGRLAFTLPLGARAITDEAGTLLRTERIRPEEMEETRQ